MSFTEEVSLEALFYDEEVCEASSKGKIMEGLFDEETYNGNPREESRRSVEESFCLDENLESRIEVSFYEESFAANPKENKDRLERQLDQVLRSFRPFREIRRIKNSFVKKLGQYLIHENEFADFNLGIMGVLNALDKGDPIEKFLRQAYIGCVQCRLCLQCDPELSNTSQTLWNHLSNAMSVLGYVMSKQGVSIPDCSAEETEYDTCTLKHLADLTDRYLKDKPDYHFLKRYEQLIMDFQVVSEIDFALRHLQDEFEELRWQPTTVSRHSEHMLFSELEERMDLSARC